VGSSTMKKLNNKGTSLVEVLIYLVVSVIVIAYALNAMTSVAKGYVNQRTVVSMQADGEDAIGVMAREIAATGFKMYLSKNVDADNKVTYDKEEEGKVTNESIYLPGLGNPFPNDSDASFLHMNGTHDDTLEFVYAKMIDAYRLDKIERIRYTLKDDTLFHRSQEYSGVDDDARDDWGIEVNIALIDNVSAVQFEFSIDGVTWVSDVTDIKHQMNFVKASILIKSKRKLDTQIDHEIIMSDDFTFIENESKSIYRLYQKIIEIPNNGRGI